MCQIGTQTAKTGQQVWRHGHADDPPHLPGTLVALRALYRYVGGSQAAGQRTTTHHRPVCTRKVQYSLPTPAAKMLNVPVPPREAQVARSQVIEVTHPLELFALPLTSSST